MRAGGGGGIVALAVVHLHCLRGGVEWRGEYEGRAPSICI